MESNRDPFMAPSGLDLGANIGRDRVIGKDISFIVFWQGWSECWLVHRTLVLVAMQRMVERSPKSRGDSRDGCRCNCSYCGGRSFGGFGKEAEDFSTMQGEEEDWGELSFKWENSQAKRRSLLYLERELDAVLHFEHGDDTGGDLKANPIWVTHILLGRLFREHQALGRAAKLFAQFQHSQIMRCMVKINKLEEKAEPR